MSVFGFFVLVLILHYLKKKLWEYLKNKNKDKIIFLKTEITKNENKIIII